MGFTPRRQIIWGGKEIDDTACGFHAASSDNMGEKGIDDMVCGFHTTSSDNMGGKELENRQCGVWVACHIVR